jgi:hypothetical protein
MPTTGPLAEVLEVRVNYSYTGSVLQQIDALIQVDISKTIVAV